MSEYPKRTRTVVFKRQLWPQPPEDAVPRWCYINTLQFVDPDDRTEVKWEQDIPEANRLQIEQGVGRHVDPGELSPRNVNRMRLEWDENFGWLLVFHVTHGLAKQMFNHYYDAVGMHKEKLDMDTGEKENWLWRFLENHPKIRERVRRILFREDGYHE